MSKKQLLKLVLTFMLSTFLAFAAIWRLSGGLIKTVQARNNVADSALAVKQLAPQVALTALQATVGATFTYQGRLTQGGNAVSGTCSITFKPFDSLTGGEQVASAITNTAVSLENGYFSQNLNFGSNVFNGDARWLEITANSCNGSGTPTTLSPRAAINPAPYAFYSLKTAPYQNMIVVAKSGGDYTSIYAAVDVISDADWDNRYLVWVAPGVYSETVTMKEYVDIEGAGRELTVIRHQGGAITETGVIIGAPDSELRNLSVASSGGTYAVAVYQKDASPFSLRNVKISAYSPNNAIGLNNNDGQVTLTDSFVSVEGENGDAIGIMSNNSNLALNNTTVNASSWSGAHSYGVKAISSTVAMQTSSVESVGGVENHALHFYSGDTSFFYQVAIKNSTLQATNSGYALYSAKAGGAVTSTISIDRSSIAGSNTLGANGSITNTGNAVYVGVSQLVGNHGSAAGGTLKCIGAYDGSYNAVTCP